MSAIVIWWFWYCWAVATGMAIGFWWAETSPVVRTFVEALAVGRAFYRMNWREAARLARAEARR